MGNNESFWSLDRDAPSNLIGDGFMHMTTSELLEFSRTPDYLHGLFENLSASAIEILLLSVTLPLVLHIVRRIQTRPIRSAVDFYLFQIFHKITRMFLDIASVRDITPVLHDEQRKNPEFQIFSHLIYGNLENILFVLKKVQASHEGYREEIEKRSREDFLRYASICDKCLGEIDRLAAMLVGVPNVQEELFHMRILVYPLRDLMEDVAEDIRKSECEPYRRQFHTYDVQEITRHLTERIDLIFTKRRKLIDSVMKNKQWRSNATLLLSLPYVMIRRSLSIRVCRFRGKPYRDFISPSNAPDLLRDWRSRKGLTMEEAAATIGISHNEYRDLEYGYKPPGIEVFSAIRR